MKKYLKEKIDKILKEKDLSVYKISKLINYSHGGLSDMIYGRRPFSESILAKILPMLEVSKDELDSWIIADKYSKESIKIAFTEQETKLNEEKKLILTKNIDKILENKNMSRTILSKIINYSQSGLNRMITGNESLSKSVISKIAPILEISEDRIKGWVLADKYSSKSIELAYSLIKETKE